MKVQTKKRPSTRSRSGDSELSVRADYLAILKMVAAIPPGKVATYGQIAWLAGLPGRARLVGRVLGEPGAMKLPWHRVINAQGRIALPKASPSHVEQRRRLRDEGLIFRSDRIDLRSHQWRPLNESPLLD